MLIYSLPIVLWFFNLELNPGIRGIWLRPDSNGKTVFVIQNAVRIMFEPFRNSFFWKMKCWDINIIMFYFLCVLFYLFVDNVLGLIPETNNKNWNSFMMKINHL